MYDQTEHHLICSLSENKDLPLFVQQIEYPEASPGKQTIDREVCIPYFAGCLRRSEGILNAHIA
jgi:hypothetical protein